MASAAQRADDGRERLVIAGATVAYVLVQVALWSVSVPMSSLIEADSLTYYRMATQLLEEGRFLEEGRQPLYPLLIAATRMVAAEGDLGPLVAIQVLALFLTAAVAWRIAKPWLATGAGAVFALVLLNPNAIALTHWPLADTVHALLFATSAWGLLAYSAGHRWWLALACGVCLGLAALTRPETQYLVLLLPLAYPVLSVAARGLPALRLALAAGVLAVVAAYAVTLPWTLHNARSGQGFAVAAAGKAVDNARGHFALVEAERTGAPQIDVIERLLVEEPALLASVGIVGTSEERDFLVSHYLHRIASADPAIVGRLYWRAWLAQFVSGGAQSFNRLLGLAIDRPDRIMNEPNSARLFWDGLRGQALLPTAITVVAVVFTLALRALGIAGLIYMAFRRHWPLLLVVATVLVFKALVHFFYGISRYRLSVEPFLMILAVYGWQGLRAANPLRAR